MTPIDRDKEDAIRRVLLAFTVTPTGIDVARYGEVAIEIVRILTSLPPIDRGAGEEKKSLDILACAIRALEADCAEAKKQLSNPECWYDLASGKVFAYEQAIGTIRVIMTDSGLPALIPEAVKVEEGENERENRQASVFEWAVHCFGDIARNLHERVSRQLEEALELAQAEGLDKQRAHDLIEYVYSRPAGDPAQEIGGILITVMAYCGAKGLSAQECEVREYKRIMSKSAEHFRDRQNAKADSGVALRSLPQAEPPRAKDAYVHEKGFSDTDSSGTDEFDSPAPSVPESRGEIPTVELPDLGELQIGMAYYHKKSGKLFVSAIPEGEEHDCDEMGCSSLGDHVIYWGARLTDEEKTRISSLRALPRESGEEKEKRIPDCPGCGRKVLSDHNSYRCDDCGRLWPHSFLDDQQTLLADATFDELVEAIAETPDNEPSVGIRLSEREMEIIGMARSLTALRKESTGKALDKLP